MLLHWRGCFWDDRGGLILAVCADDTAAFLRCGSEALVAVVAHAPRTAASDHLEALGAVRPVAGVAEPGLNLALVLVALVALDVQEVLFFFELLRQESNRVAQGLDVVAGCLFEVLDHAF